MENQETDHVIRKLITEINLWIFSHDIPLKVAQYILVMIDFFIHSLTLFLVWWAFISVGIRPFTFIFHLRGVDMPVPFIIDGIATFLIPLFIYGAHYLYCKYEDGESS